MDTRLLRTFIAVVENRGFAHAAEELGYSQPTVSAQIALLEDDLGAKLFARDRRPVRLTPAGEALLVHARTILNEIEAARGNVLDRLGARRGTVRLGSYPSATAGYVPRVLREFRTRFPQVNVQLVELSSGAMEQAALSGEVMLFLRQTLPPLSAALFESRPLWREDFKVVMRADHALAKRAGPIAPEALLRHELIMTGRQVADGLLTYPFWYALGEAPRVAYEVTQPQSLIELVRAGLGIGVLNQLALDVSRSDGLAVRAINHPEAVRDVALYWLRGRVLSAPAQALLSFMVEEADAPRGTRTLRSKAPLVGRRPVRS